jgi:hypothetical protein
LVKAGTVSITGTVLYSGTKAIFKPTIQLPGATTFTATVSTAAQSASGQPLANAHEWTFTTGNSLIPTKALTLGTAGDFVVLAKTGISTVPQSAFTGDLGVSPAAATYLTGFSLTKDAGNTFSTSTQVTGHLFAADYAVPTPAKMTLAVEDMELAFSDAAGRTANMTELGAGNIGGMNLTTGVYKWGTGLLIPTDLTLSGSPTDVWIMQIAGNLTLAEGKNIILSGGALSKNVYWQVSGQANLGTTSHMEGIVLSQTSITLGTGASMNGRLFAQTAVIVESATVLQPAP